MSEESPRSCAAPGGVRPDLRRELANRLDRLVATVGYQARGHYLASKSAARWNNLLSLTVIAATALTTTGVITVIAGDDFLAIPSAILGFVAAVASGAQKVGNYAEQASKFQAAGARFDRLRADARQLQFAVAQLPPGQVEDGPQRLHDLEYRRADASAEAPDLKDRFYDKAKAEAESKLPPQDAPPPPGAQQPGKGMPS